jgi:hypothetical protein
MRTLVVLAALAGAGYGWEANGLAGAATALVGVIGVGSGLIIALNGPGTEGRGSVPLTTSQRWGGAFASLGVIVGLNYGGWQSGWMWGAVGYFSGSFLGLLTTGGRGAGIGRGTKFVERDALSVPERFDLADPTHVLLMDRVRQAYADLLADASHPYNRALYRPASVLPYPKPVIERVLRTLLDVAEGRASSPLIEFGSDPSAAADTIRAVLTTLDDFLDVPAAELPTEPKANLMIGTEIRRRAQGGQQFTDWIN